MAVGTKTENSFGQLCGHHRYDLATADAYKSIVHYDNVTQQDVSAQKYSLVANVEHVKQLLREVQILTRFKHHNIIEMTDLLQSSPDRDHLFIFQLSMPSNLEHLLQNVDRKQFTPQHIEWFTYQVACGVKYIHSAGVVHRDLKPSNILIDEQCNLKISSFGSARTDNSPYLPAEYVEKHYYRSPEVLLGARTNAKTMDIWSIGCIFAEMWRSGPLFCGQNSLNQLEVIFDVLGTPSSEELESISSSAAVRKYVEALEITPRQPWNQVLQLADVGDVKCMSGFLDDLLAYDPHRRATIEQVLKHPLLSAFHDIGHEPVHDGVLAKELAFANWSLEKLQHAIQLEVTRFQTQSTSTDESRVNYV